MSACPALESLSIKWGYQASEKQYDFVEDQSLKNLDRAARFAIKSLESLRLIHQEDIAYTRNGFEEYACSFANFPRLKFLRLGLIFIFGLDLIHGAVVAGRFYSSAMLPPVTLLEERPTLVHQLASALPPNIETLRLMTTDENSRFVRRRVPLFANIEYVMKMARNQFPFLKSIILECALPHPFRTPPSAEEFLGHRPQEISWDVLLDCAYDAGIDFKEEWINMANGERKCFPREQCFLSEG